MQAFRHVVLFGEASYRMATGLASGGFCYDAVKGAVTNYKWISQSILSLFFLVQPFDYSLVLSYLCSCQI